jgi:hypothetical protein
VPPDVLDFDEFVDVLRIRLGHADAIKGSGDLHSFKTLMDEWKDVTPPQWYWEAFDELDAQGHLHDQSIKQNGGDAIGRLSADGREHLRLNGEL